jgi:TetR/AcrR family transcriptional regulator
MPARLSASHPRRRRHTARGPGRPGKHARGPQRDLRETLLAAAARLFAARGVEDVSLRELARAADATPAMVHYYFGDKRGLYDALLERALARVLERVRAVTEAPAGADEIAALVAVAVGTLSAEPWIPALIIREVLAEPGRFRERFIAGYASQLAQVLPALIAREQRRGRLRRDLDPQLAFVSVVGMTVWPFAVRPVLERALGLRLDAEGFAPRFAEHTRRLFLEGAARRERKA